MQGNARGRERKATTRHSALRLLRAMLFVCIVLLLVLFAGFAWTARQEAQHSADQRIERALDVLHEHTLKVFQTAELLILGVNTLTETMSDAEIAANSLRLHELLKRMTMSLGEKQSVWITGRDGRPLVTDVVEPMPPLAVADRDFFQVQSARDAGTYVSAVISPKLPGRPSFFALSHRRAGEAGFNGTIHVALQPGQLARFYADLSNLGDYFALIRDDGAFLVRYPIPKDPTPRASGAGPASMLAANPGRGIYTADSVIDGRQRRIGYRKLDGYPAYVLAGVETAAIRSEWLGALGRQLLFGLPVTALLIAALIIALSRTRRLYDEEAKRATAEEELRHAQGLETLGQMTGGVAHDFNNLLMVVLGTVEQMRRTVKGKREERWLDAIEAAGRRGERLTSQLLSFARRQTLAAQPVDIALRLPELSEMLRRSLRGDIALTIARAEGVCVALIDAAEFEIALLNLAVNARDAMPRGGTLTIAVRQVALRGEPDGLSGEFVAVMVGDSGVGIAPEVLPQIFAPFFTTKEIGKGTGLGLSQVYGFARQSGGTATVESVPGAGTTVTLYLPCGEIVPAPASDAVPRHDAIGAGLHVVLVEDNAAVAEVTRDYLEQLGFTVDVAGAANEALRLLDAAPADLVLSDIVMPGGMNGLDLARELRRRRPDLAIVLASGYSDSAEQAMREGFALLRKPYDLGRLRDALRAELALAIPTGELAQP
jgi:two-component system NtrC family sensor kinase